jgi:hypothetical protein
MSASPTVESRAWRPSPQVASFLQGAPNKLLANGKWVAARSGKTFETINPATEQVVAQKGK